MHQSVLGEIQELRGMTEFKTLAERMKIIADNRRMLSTAQIHLPNYLFAVAPGCGVTTHLHQMARLLDELGLMRFEGEQKCFEWIIDKDAFAPEGAFDRLLDRIKAMAGFRNSFYGVIGLDIDDWCDQADSARLTRLLDFSEDMKGQILFVFVVDLQDEKRIDAIAERLSREMPLEIIRFPLPSVDDLTFTLSDFLQARGFSLEQDAFSYLKDIISKLVSFEHFDGFQTLDNLADEIVYQFCSKGKVSEPRISVEDVRFIEQSGGYLERLGRSSHRNKNKHQRIGFANGRNV